MTDLIKARQRLDEIEALVPLLQGDTDVVMLIGKAISELRQALA